MPLGLDYLQHLQEALQEEIVELEVLKDGGQAAVLRGRRIRTPSGTHTDDSVAVKLYANIDEDERIVREIDAASCAKSDTLVDLLSHGITYLGDTRARYLVCRFIEGQPLSELLQDGPKPTIVPIVGRDVSTAIVTLWKQRIVHRDITPKNIILRTGIESAVLIDLGIAKRPGDGALTAAGETWGTRGYLSPEQSSGARLTCMSDVFSLGVTLQHALAGVHPTGFNQNQLNSGGRPTHEVAPNAPARLAHLIDRMLSPRPARRPNPEELVDTFLEMTVRS
jgi:eukaryotic-like serine/threonine-protein kinase